MTIDYWRSLDPEIGSGNTRHYASVRVRGGGFFWSTYDHMPFSPNWSARILIAIVTKLCIELSESNGQRFITA